MVINGDVLTDLSIAAFAACHARSDAMVTVATAMRETVMDFGVIEAVDGRVTNFREKPRFANMMSMGIYCMEPEVFRHIPHYVPFGFDDLALCLLARGEHIHTYLHEGLWLDIGRIEDFQAAQTPDLGRAGAGARAPRVRRLRAAEEPSMPRQERALDVACC